MAFVCEECGVEACDAHCVHCLTDCSLDLDHAVDCPAVTGVYPNSEALCARCDADMEVYVLADIGGGFSELICIGCAQHAAM